MWVFPLLAAIVAFVFAGLLTRDYLARRRSYQGLWALAMAMYGIASLAAAGGVLNHWSPLEYKLYWSFGAILNVPFLAAGELLLLFRSAAVKVATALALIFICSFTFGVMREVHPGDSTISATALAQTFPSGKCVFSENLMTKAMNGKDGSPPIFHRGSSEETAIAAGTKKIEALDTCPGHEEAIATAYVTAFYESGEPVPATRADLEERALWLPRYVAIPSYFILVLGALWSAFKMRGRRDLRPRFVGTLLIALGSTVVAMGAVFALKADLPGFSATLVIGIGLMFWGFLKASKPVAVPEPTQVDQPADDPSSPQVSPTSEEPAS